MNVATERSGDVLVSVGIPTFARSTYVMRAIESVLTQTHHNLEVIVSDNASTDDTLERVRTVTDPRVVLLAQERNLGMTGNFNACLDAAKGRYFLMLSDDDFLDPAAIARLLAPMEAGLPGHAADTIALAWTPCTVIDAEGETRWVTDAGPAVEPGLDLLVGMFEGVRGPRLCGILCRTSDVRVSGGYLDAHGPVCDVGNWGKTILRYTSVACTEAPLSSYTMHRASTSSTTLGKTWQRGGEHIFADLIEATRVSGDERAALRLRSARVQFVSALLATVIMQSIGKPGWMRYALSEVLRAPQYLLAPRTILRLAKGATKLLKLVKSG